MRLASLIVLGLALVGACGSSSTSSAAAHRSAAPSSPAVASPSASPLPPTVGGVVELTLPHPSSPGSGCMGCGTSSLGGAVAGGDGNVWFADGGRDALDRVTPAGVITEFQLPGSPTGDQPLARGPDGTIWAVVQAEQGSSSWIAHVDAAGKVATFQVPALETGYAAGLDGIAVAPDGTVWATEFFASAVLRMDRGGAFKSFPTNQPDSAPAAIALGADGNVWFEERPISGLRLAKLTPAGAITDYRISAASDSPGTTALVRGPDGNLWFAAGAGIGRATSSGELTLFPLPAGAGAGALTVGPDGKLWFTDTALNAVGKLGFDGAVREYPLPRRAAWPSGIAAGADGRIWFAESGVSRIARIGTSVPLIRLSVSDVIFGASAGARTVQVTNTGDGALQFQDVGVSGPDATGFHVADNSCSGATVNPGSSCSVTITVARGSRTDLIGAQLLFADNASGTPQAVSLVANLVACRLPLATPVTPPATTMNAQWLDVVGGTVSPDPSGTLVADPATELWHTSSKPVLTGSGGPSYDPVARRWVVASTSAISTDGKRYAYIAGGIGHAELHVVDVATGTDTKLPALASFQNVFSWGLFRFAPEGIYLVQERDNVGPAPGLWLVNPDTGEIRKVGTEAVSDVGDGAAWLQVVDPRDPHPAVSQMSTKQPNELVRQDLSTGAKVTWLYRPGATVYIASPLTSGVVVGVDDTTWVLSGPDAATEMVDPRSGDPLAGAANFEDAPQGIWFATVDGIYLWNSRVGAVHVSSASGYPAGPCQ